MPEEYYSTIGIVVGILASALFLIRQLKHNGKSYESNAYGELYAEQNNIHRFFIENDHLRPYFLSRPLASSSREKPVNEKLENKLNKIVQSQSSGEEDIAEEVKIAAEMMADFFEHIWVKRNIIPEDARDGWLEYIKSRYNDSLAIQRHFDDPVSSKWYSVGLKNLVKPTPC
jgi:hypothetical protein